jgi:Golgi nucleoside diphosphatase
VETEPGLDHFVDDGEGLRSRALGPLLDWAEAVIPPARWASTPLFLFGTAGLRKLGGSEQARVMEEVRDALAASNFR